ncbi:transcriptional regulator [Aureimonas endophytica]|uniref:Transcriptional regulator n=1 Tax=Aureimonas endophytica TaxID=2027858 RepID=A0A917E8M5_9HYPH|nr:sulfurtransferase TusA family protein [Aureimonas endophytica]GGE14030.1 transcriptional regulator [Aureimonas endophytica]
MTKAEDGAAMLDLRGLRCPLPVLRTEKALKAAPAGTTLVVLADDPLAGLDIPHLCREKGYELLAAEARDSHRRFTLRKGA